MMNPKHLINALFSPLIDFIYPPVCLICEQRSGDGESVCPDCWASVMAAMRPHVQSEHSDFHHLAGEIHFDAVVTFWEYSAEIESIIHAVKYGRSRKLGVRMGRQVGRALKDVLSLEDPIFIPVPLHTVRKRERGYNQSELFCRGLSEYIPGRVDVQCLKRRRHTSTQTKLNAPARQANMRDAFRARYPESIWDRDVVLVDDVITSGATVNSCVAVLKDAGARRVYAVALARPELSF